MSYDDRSLVRSVQQPFTEFLHTIFSFEDRLRNRFHLEQSRDWQCDDQPLVGLQYHKTDTFDLLHPPSRLHVCFHHRLRLLLIRTVRLTLAFVKVSSFSFLSNHVQV